MSRLLMSPSPTRRVLLGCLAAQALTVPRVIPKTGVSSDDDFVVVHGWVPRKSDLDRIRS